MRACALLPGQRGVGGLAHHVVGERQSVRGTSEEVTAHQVVEHPAYLSLGPLGEGHQQLRYDGVAHHCRVDQQRPRCRAQGVDARRDHGPQRVGGGHPTAHARQLQRVQRHAAGSRRELLAALDPRHELTGSRRHRAGRASSGVPRTAGCPSLGAAWRARVER